MQLAVVFHLQGVGLDRDDWLPDRLNVLSLVVVGDGLRHIHLVVILGLLAVVLLHLLPVVLGVQYFGLTGRRLGRFPGHYRLVPCLPKPEAVAGLGLGFLTRIFAT